MDIHRLIHKFWNEYFWWTITPDKIQKFFNAKLQEYILWKEHTIGNILCTPIIYPNGDEPESKGEVVYGIEFQWSSDIKSILIYHELYCEQTQKSYKNTMLASTIYELLFWTESMKLSECKKEIQLDFMYHIDILRIEYSDATKKQYYKDTKISNKSNCIWDISFEQLEKWKSYSVSQGSHGVSFDNNNWALWCDPKGWKGAEYFSPGVTLLNMPYNIKQMNIKMILDIEPNICHLEETKCMENTNETWDMDSDLQLTLDEIINKANNSSIAIHCAIEIIDICFRDDK